MKEAKRKALGKTTRRIKQKQRNGDRDLVTDLPQDVIEQSNEDLCHVLEILANEGEPMSAPFYVRGLRDEYRKFLWDITPEGQKIGFTLNLLIGRIKAAHERKCLRNSK